MYQWSLVTKRREMIPRIHVGSIVLMLVRSLEIGNLQSLIL